MQKRVCMCVRVRERIGETEHQPQRQRIYARQDGMDEAMTSYPLFQLIDLMCGRVKRQTHKTKTKGSDRMNNDNTRTQAAYWTRP